MLKKFEKSSGNSGVQFARRKPDIFAAPRAFTVHRVRHLIILRIIQTCTVTLRRPLRKKLRMMWFFDISKVKESSFF